MTPYWIVFTDGTKGCCEGYSAADSLAIAEKLTGKKVAAAPLSLPYPAHPIIWQVDHPVMGRTPTFCSSPDRCAGRSCCPRDYACTE